MLKGGTPIKRKEEGVVDGFHCRYGDIADWEVVSIGEEYYRMLKAHEYSWAEGELTEEDLKQLLDVYHYWKILLDCRFPRFEDKDFLLYSLHFDLIIELFCHRKMNGDQRLSWILE